MLISLIKYFGESVFLACDGKCNKAWGSNGRPRRDLSTDLDDYEYLSDGELGDAPQNPGTYEGRDGKPVVKSHNKWCARECERSVITRPVQFTMTMEIQLPDFSERIKNLG